MKSCKLFLPIALALLSQAATAQNPFAESEFDLLFNRSESATEVVIGEIDQINREINDILAPDTSAKDDYTVVRGNSLSQIAGKLLGNPRRWRDLVDWNADRYPSLLKNPDLILVGWKLRLAPPAEPNKPSGSANTSVAEKPATDASSQETTMTDNESQNGTTPTSAPQPAANASGPIIKPDSRVLHIGDSHTCGIYGKAMDELMRSTGAAINTIGVSGSSPSWWLNETVGKSGYFAKDENGRIDQPADWRTPRQTPNLNKLIKDYKPGVIVFSLGANMINSSPESIRNQVKSVCEIAKNAGCQIVWIGPPNGRADKKPTEKQTRLYDNLKAEAEKYGTFIDSRPYTRYPESGGDGVHFWGNEGSKIARDWAGKIFNDIQKPQ